MRHKAIIRRSRKQKQQLREKLMLTSNAKFPLLNAKRRRHIKSTKITRLQIKLRNTRKIGYLIIERPDTKICWTLHMRRTRYNSQAFKDLGLTLSAKFKTLLRRHWCANIHIKTRKKPGMVRISLRTILWALRRAHQRNHITQMTVHLPRAHGYRTLKKPARRKRRLQRLRARRLRRTY